MRNEIINGAKFESLFACVCTVQWDRDVHRDNGCWSPREGKNFLQTWGGAGSKTHLKTKAEAGIEYLFPNGTDSLLHTTCRQTWMIRLSGTHHCFHGSHHEVHWSFLHFPQPDNSSWREAIFGRSVGCNKGLRASISHATHNRTLNSPILGSLTQTNITTRGICILKLDQDFCTGVEGTRKKYRVIQY